MNIKIKNFGKIHHANIEINGITILAGNNNTGKTTVGKTLFAVFNSIYGMNEKIRMSRRQEIILRWRNTFRAIYLSRFVDEGDGISQRYNTSRKIEMVSHDFSRHIRNTSVIDDDYEEIFNSIIRSCERYALPVDEKMRTALYISLRKDLEEVNRTDDYSISLEIIDRFFKGVFSEQVSNLLNSNDSEICLSIHNQNIGTIFKNNSCFSWSNDFEIMHEAFFIDDPFILDNLNSMYSLSGTGLTHREFLLSKIENSATDEDANVISSVLAKEKLKEISQIINNVVPEKLEQKNGEWVITSEGFSESITVDNMSAGVKSFLLLKVLLEKGILKEKDVLIMDEPEIHLHPEWQIKYAETIVLLHKLFDLSILVTTHSRDFFEALTLYSKKYSVMDKCKYYIAESIGKEIDFVDVTSDTTRIYRQLVNPSKLLDQIKFELEEQNE